MYNEILNGVKLKHSLTSESETQSHLQNLQSSVKLLREAFRIFPVKFDYTNIQVQQAYMFAYYPHYTELLEYVLINSKEQIGQNFPKKLLLFGSGPCPEIIGYLKFINNYSLNKNCEIGISIFDIASTHWEYSRNLTFNQIVPSYQNEHKIINNSAKDFKINLPLGDVNLSNEPQLVVYQNCLNEINVGEHKIVINNLKKLYQNLPKNSLMAIIDFHEYPEVVDLITQIQNNLSNEPNFKLLRDVKLGVINKTSTYKNPTQIIRENLMTGIPFQLANGLIPRSKVNFTYSLMKKE